jgi:parallel beta-helix repeat protein
MRTIQNAVNCLGPGDTLYLRDGNYSDGMTHDGSQASGTSWSNAITVTAYPGETATLTGGGIAMYAGGYWIFDRLIIDTRAGAFWQNCPSHHLRVQNSVLKNAVGANIGGCGDANEFLNNDVTGATFRQPDHEASSCYGIYWSGSNTLFEGNNVHDNDGYGLHMYSWGQSNVSGNVVRNNVFANNGRNAVSGGNVSCNLGSGGGSVILSCGSNNKFYNNVIYDSSMGLQIDYRCTNCEAYNNTIYNNTSAGLAGVTLGESVVNARVQNNIVYNNGQPGIANNGSSGATISNNWLDSTNLAIITVTPVRK